MIKKFLMLSIIPCIVLFGVTEMALRGIGFHYQPRQKLLSKPTVAGFTRTIERYYDTVFDPPGYMWIRADRIAGEKPDGERTYTWPVEKPAGERRVAFLGGSTSEPSGPGTYPARCIKLLNDVAGTEAFDMLNVACSSYSSHQSLIALRRYVFPRHPDVVVVYHGWNDTFLSPSHDGFSDKEKDYLVTKGNIQEKGAPRWAALGQLRVTQLLGKILDACDLTWPRARVSERDLYRNLSTMAKECDERGIAMVLVVRPIADAAVTYMDQLPEHDIKAYRKYGPGKEQLYQGIHDMVLGVQRRVAQENPKVRVADANAYFDAAPEVKGPIADPTAIALFVKDCIHATNLGNQRMAEVVAKAIAPDLSDQIVRYINSVDYWKNVAIDCNHLLSPYEAEYAVAQAEALDSSRAADLKPIADEANGQKEFFKNFYYGRWWGAPDEYAPEVKIGMLKQCLQMQPSDYGVAVQIFRVALYSQRPELGAPVLDGFKGTSPQEVYDVLRNQFMLWIQARRWNEAVKTAQNLLAINANDPDAREFLRQIQQASVPQAMDRIQQ